MVNRFSPGQREGIALIDLRGGIEQDSALPFAYQMR